MKTIYVLFIISQSFQGGVGIKQEFLSADACLNAGKTIMKRSDDVVATCIPVEVEK